eukprot:TRINITY_DN10845_c0_g1_i1.p1 TRINITY_DN10845_c0_g1~~TRINITY_DN10845_c0_g1_i1.p1  ORF type:complete len:298 (-),score=58.20 TRINITY_DN10845_c0_g1_i1:120-1013(-)
MAAQASKYVFNGKINWFPGHMQKGTRKISEMIQNVNVVLEVRDARLPVTSSNPMLKEVTNNKKRIIIMNKADLCNRNVLNQWIQKIKQEPNVLDVVPTTASTTKKKHITAINKASNPNNSTFKRVWLICGMPNVGKSTLINALSDKNRAPVASTPGKTRGNTMYNVKFSNSVLMDTPGIMLPNFDDPIAGLKLGLCSLLEPKRFTGGAHSLCEYVLHILNSKNKSYKDYYGIEEDIETVDKLLHHIQYIKKFQHTSVAESHFLKAFGDGKLGKFVLDDIQTDTYPTISTTNTTEEEY